MPVNDPSTRLMRIPPPPLSARTLHEWWHAPSGYREVLQLAWPLILSNSTGMIMQFFDRIFLAWYDPAAMAASTPAGAMAFTLQSLFIGMAGYVATFVAQYTGDQRPERAVSAVWQAIYFSLAAALLILGFMPLGGWLFQLAGHSAELQAQELPFFRIFLGGSIFFLLGSAVSGYYIGRGETRLVLYISLLSVLINLLLAWGLIFGNFGCPRLGISGAALASVSAQAVGAGILFVIFLRETRPFHSRRLEWPLFLRFLRFSSPNGLQTTLDMGIWTFFLLRVGGMGVTAIGASSIAFQINSVAFWPMFGLAMAASTLVGQRLGEDRPDLAARATWSAFHMTLAYTVVAVLLFVLAPGLFILPYQVHADPAAFLPIGQQAVILLRFVSLYVLFDTVNIIFSSALKGAGDVFFVMLSSNGLGILLLLLPVWLFCGQDRWGLYGAWIFLTLFICVLAGFFLWRFLRGHWQTMRVIEREITDHLSPEPSGHGARDRVD